MPGVIMIHHVNVPITDRQRTRQWYEEVLGAEFLERGPERNERQLQLRIGSGEMHVTELPEQSRVPAGHFAVEVDDWEATLARLDALGVSYSRMAGGRRATAPGEDERYGQRDDTDQYYTYIQDPDGNVIELVYHPLGLEDATGSPIEVPRHEGMRWRQRSGAVNAT